MTEKPLRHRQGQNQNIKTSSKTDKENEKSKKPNKMYEQSDSTLTDGNVYTFYFFPASQLTRNYNRLPVHSLIACGLAL